MYVDQIILEGFKTYMNRTVITNFDSNFNAITGLNGSGKSNILDAIQFLLGSTSKEMLRLKSGLSQLIYKEGFAGIQKASVTIRFKCPDKDHRPSGYENCDQLIVTRQITKDKVSKIFVNGLSSNLSKVKALFRSVNMNIENPHFLVKQGQITKIINLKPTELLGMIEQTAGTAYYNRTKLESEKIMEKKQLKLRSVQQILLNSIVPEMDKLNADRRKYNAFREKENYTKKKADQIKTYEFVTKSNQLRRAERDITPLSTELQSLKKQCSQLNQTIGDKQGQIKIWREQGGDAKSYQQYKNKKQQISQLNHNLQRTKKRVKELNEQSISLQKEKNQNNQKMENRKKESAWQLKLLGQAEKKKEQIDNLISQINSSRGQDQARVLLERQERQLASHLKSLETEKKLLEEKKVILSTQEQNQQRNKEDMMLTHDELSKQLTTLEKQIVELQKVIKPKQVQNPQIGSHQLKTIQKRIYDLENRNYQLTMRFNNPNDNFDRNRVKGKIFMLFKSNRQQHQKALEVGGGGKLFNIVVDNQQTSQTLIEKESFGKSVTIVPLNKIRPKELRTQVVINAKKIAKHHNGFADLASNLVQYDEAVANAIKFAFGDFIICENANIAKEIAFNHNKILTCKCVTLDGDVFEPGTLTGGMGRNEMRILRDFKQLQSLRGKRSQQQQKVKGNKEEYTQYIKQQNKYEIVVQDLKNKRQRVERIKQKLAKLALNLKQRDFKRQQEELLSKMVVINQDYNKTEQKRLDVLDRLTKGMNLEDQKKQLLKEKKQIEGKLKSIKKSSSVVQIDIQQLVNEISHLQVGQEDLEKQIRDLEKKRNELETALTRVEKQFYQLERKREIQLKQQMINATRIDNYSRDILELKKQLAETEKKLTNLNSSVQLKTKEIKNLTDAIKKLMDENQWLIPDRDYEIASDFRYQSAVAQYNQLTREVDLLKKTAKINIDQNSYNKLQQQYKDLLAKKETLTQDKLTLKDNIHNLDMKRTQTLEQCFGSVKDNLSRIFSDLLPGATAHLNKVNQHDVTEGVEIWVEFNGVKKQLSELSGGQRSLLALSFILALLLYKPSPFYILDQIDSALDLSHTQNIGHMIRSRFPQSQFILISLKEGMFQNAHVLYKVSFVDGESKVERQTLKKK